MTFVSVFFQRVHLDIDIGEHAIDYQQVSAKEKLTELQLRVRQLLDQVEQMFVEKETFFCHCVSFSFSETKNRVINDTVKNVFERRVNQRINVFSGGPSPNYSFLLSPVFGKCVI